METGLPEGRAWFGVPEWQGKPGKPCESDHPWSHTGVHRGQRHEPDGKAKYTGLHALRHFYASWCINSKDDGGLGLSAKVAQARLGHSTIAMTLDTYGHLFPRGDDGSELAAAEKSLLG
jgi:integrase